MTATAIPAPETRRIEVPGWAWFVVALAVFLVYLMLQENGALLERSWERIHEFFHDGRHFLAVPCH
ncbi:MAG: CbtB domain-containing protein [Acidimicrobiia bacterium]